MDLKQEPEIRLMYIKASLSWIKTWIRNYDFVSLKIRHDENSMKKKKTFVTLKYIIIMAVSVLEDGSDSDRC